MTILDIERSFIIDAQTIKNNYELASLSHTIKNIATAGDTVESYIRDLIRKRISNKYYTTQGHIVDAQLSTSGQFDILVADDKGSPIINSYRNGTDILTYESICAIGEIKASYSRGKKEPITEFIEKVKQVNENLMREKMDVFQRSQDYKVFGNNFNNSQRTEHGWLYKNPIFKFMFFVNSSKLKLETVLNILDNYEKIHLPNIICLLDRGIIAYVNKTNTGFVVENYPEFIQDDTENKFQLKMLGFTNTAAATFAYLIYALNFHLSNCVVSKADLMKYHNKLFQVVEIHP